MKTNRLSLFIFRRDLRLDDNTALIEALKTSDFVIPVFCLDPRQLQGNPYRGEFLIQFLRESLLDLNSQLEALGSRLYVFHGIVHEVLENIAKQHPVEAVFVNRDYTPFSIQRDLSLQHACESRGVRFHSFGDALLHEPEDIKKDDGGIYTVYTPFARRALMKPVRPTVQNSYRNYWQDSLKDSDLSLIEKHLKADCPQAAVRGGRQGALKTLVNLKKFKAYAEQRDFPAIEGTTRLSAHHKFGTVSIREVYYTASKLFGAECGLIKELLWRDFFTHVGFHHPFVLGEAFQERFRRISWSDDLRAFDAWCKGRTGFPMVDAGMRELNTTGYMHNRVRMITASFLVKDLHIDWRWGEKYFAQKLVDYDPLVNNGNWQWAASTGCDAQPYFRIFNPWLQQKKFDPDCVYIKNWVPELRDLSSDVIHGLYETPLLKPRDYFAPMVDHRSASEAAKRLFKV